MLLVPLQALLSRFVYFVWQTLYFPVLISRLILTLLTLLLALFVTILKPLTYFIYATYYTLRYPFIVIYRLDVFEVWESLLHGFDL